MSNLSEPWGGKLRRFLRNWWFLIVGISVVIAWSYDRWNSRASSKATPSEVSSPLDEKEPAPIPPPSEISTGVAGAPAQKGKPTRETPPAKVVVDQIDRSAEKLGKARSFPAEFHLIPGAPVEITPGIWISVVGLSGGESITDVKLVSTLWGTRDVTFQPGGPATDIAIDGNFYSLAIKRASMNNVTITLSAKK